MCILDQSHLIGAYISSPEPLHNLVPKCMLILRGGDPHLFDPDHSIVVVFAFLKPHQ